MGCLSCGRGFHEECISEPCCCNEEPIENETTSRRRRDGVIGTSAGRKRAALDYPLDREAACEWRGLANCGGGKLPIVGCIVGKQEHRHHGPVKNTANNNKGNVHRICTRCHNRWHAKNDPVYDETIYETLPHNPREATIEEQMTRGSSI